MTTSCGVIVTDGRTLLLGHATRSRRWDIPKGLMEAGETQETAALRELREETGLAASRHALIDLGLHAYMRGKDLALMAWLPERMPDPASLSCASTFAAPSGALPEFDRFGIFAWDEALSLVGRNLARVLGPLRHDIEKLKR